MIQNLGLDFIQKCVFELKFKPKTPEEKAKEEEERKKKEQEEAEKNKEESQKAGDGAKGDSSK